MKRFLTIAGSDPSGGAGVQADIRAAVLHGLLPLSVITALTAQTALGVRNIIITPAEFVKEQLDTVFCESAPNAIKIGMLGSAGNVEALVNVFREWEPKNVVLDTVFSSTSGYTLLTKGGIEALKEKLIPLCSAITPNIPEAQILTGDKLLSKKDMERAALILNKRYKVDVIITGGHLENECSDLLFSNGVLTWFSGKKVSGQSHGTGCKFSSAIAANLALGYPLNECVQKAKAYVVERILGDASN